MNDKELLEQLFLIGKPYIYKIESELIDGNTILVKINDLEIIIPFAKLESAKEIINNWGRVEA